ncbi:MAG: nucleotidyltransferase domain-containing protein [Elusimicrobia bacterium]|nr:nucleotidyltransferase domain-containing protein [Elusimicrobiota bacterium]
MQEELLRFAGELQETFEEDLISVILYGSAAKGTHMEGTSDINLLIVMRDVSLDDILAASAKARGERFSLVFWTEAELRRAPEIFPIDFRDILAGYKVLCGADVLSRVSASGRNLRRQLEFELRSKLQRLRSSWPELRGDKAALEKALSSAGPSFARLLDEAKSLPGIRLREDAGKAFEECSRLKRREIRPGLEGLESLYEDVHEAAEMLVGAVDVLG